MAGVIITDMGGVILADARGLGGVPRYVRGPNEGKARAYQRRRKMSRIVGVGGHHWGPPSPSLVPRSGESMVDAAVRRSLSTVYHVSVWAPHGLPCVVVLAWPFDLVTWHGNGLNYPTIGLALAGNFPALEAERHPAQDDPLDFMPGIRVALELIKREVPNAARLYTHSQAAPKPADPGELAARLLAAEGARVGIAADPDWTAPRPKPTSPKGQPWPAEWRVPFGSGGRAYDGPEVA